MALTDNEKVKIMSQFPQASPGELQAIFAMADKMKEERSSNIITGIIFGVMLWEVFGFGTLFSKKSLKRKIW